MLNFDVAAMRLIGLSNAQVQQALQVQAQLDESLLKNPNPSEYFLMRVTEVHRETIVLHDGQLNKPASEQVRARVHPSLVRVLIDGQSGIAVGDWIICYQDEHRHWWVNQILAPTTQIIRRDGDGRRHIVVSNIDMVFIVMGLDHDFSPRRLERYLALIHASGEGIMPIVVLTKADQCLDTDSALDQLRDRIPSHVPIHCVNGLADETRAELLPYLIASQTIVLLGSSGAGKSTLTNNLMQQTIQDTGAVRVGDSRGKHTTTARSLHCLEGGACIIDTPGVRTLRPDTDEQTLTGSFADIDALSKQCRFSNCTHNTEPDCAVRAGVIPDRLRNYQKLLRDVRRDTLTPLQKQTQQREWRTRSKAGRARLKQKTNEG